MNYDRAAVERYFAGLTPDSKPCQVGICPLMVVYPNMRRMSDATRADRELVLALDKHYKLVYGSSLPWAHYTAEEILGVIRLVNLRRPKE